MSISSISNKGGSRTSKSERSRGVDKKDEPKKADAPRAEEQKTDASRKDGFESRGTRTRTNTLATTGTGKAFWEDKNKGTAAAIQREAKAQWKEHLGRDISDEEASRLAKQAQGAGCVNEKDAHAYFEHMVKGSPEYAVNQDVRGQFQALLGRDPGAEGAAQAMKDWKVPSDPAAARSVIFNNITGSAEFKAQHPEAVSTTFTDVDQASQHWVSQWGPTASNNPPGSGIENDIPYGFKDCGPTSAVTLASALGLTEHPSPETASQAIDHMRDLAFGHDTSESHGTGTGQMAQALEAVGAKTQALPGTLAAVDKALGEGKMLMIAGNPWNAWGREMSKGPNGDKNQWHYLNSKDPGPHWVAVLGKTPEGKYLVSDPLSKTGAIAVSGEQLEQFFRDGGGSSGSLSVWNPKGNGPGVSMPPPPHIDVPPAPTGTLPPPSSPATPPAPSTPPASQQVSVPTENLEAGDRSPAVEQLQTALVKAGYLREQDMKTGPGIYGPKTQAAVKKLQEEYGIQGNGGKDFGPKTHAALERALRGDKPPAPSTPAPASGVSGVANLSPEDKALAAQINAHIARMSPDGKLKGYGEVIVDACRQNHIPVDMALAMLQKESSYLSPDNTASIANNNPGNMRFPSKDKAWVKELQEVYGGKPGGRGGFTQFPSIENGIRAYARLMRHVYGEQVDKRDWNSLITKYCPPEDNTSEADPTGEKFTAKYIEQMKTFSSQWRDRLDIDTSWVNG